MVKYSHIYCYRIYRIDYYIINSWKLIIFSGWSYSDKVKKLFNGSRRRAKVVSVEDSPNAESKVKAQHKVKAK